MWSSGSEVPVTVSSLTASAFDGCMALTELGSPSMSGSQSGALSCTASDCECGYIQCICICQDVSAWCIVQLYGWKVPSYMLAVIGPSLEDFVCF